MDKNTQPEFWRLIYEAQDAVRAFDCADGPGRAEAQEMDRSGLALITYVIDHAEALKAEMGA